MNRTTFLIVSAALSLSVAAGAADSKPLRVCMLSGSWEYKSEETLPKFKAWLEENYNVECKLLQATKRDNLPGTEALDDCDVALFFSRRLEIDGEQLARIQKYATSGKPIVACRTASHGFQKWLDMDKLILGGNYNGHFGSGPTTQVKIEERAKKHPILDGVPEFRSRASLYKNQGIAGDRTLLLTGSTPESNGSQPIAWARVVNGGRVFYTSLGAPTDYQHAAFRRMMANALFWAAKRDLARKKAAAIQPCEPARKRTITLELRGREKVGDDWKETKIEREIALDRTAIIVCDVWDRHWCASANKRCGEMVPQMNAVLDAARENGALIIHAPSGTLVAYEGTPARRRAIEAPKAEPPFPVDKWQNLDRSREGALPIDDSDGGCDCQPQCKQYSAWTAQHPGIDIHDCDAISDRGQEVYNLLAQRNIDSVFVLGVHTNMCVLGRPFGLRQLTKLKKNPVLLRDLTDTMYNPRMPPKVSHAKGTELVIEHVEKYWCPTALSTDLLAKLQ